MITNGEDEFARWRKKQERLLRWRLVEGTVTTVRNGYNGQKLRFLDQARSWALDTTCCVKGSN
jgi:hypothetical protein